MNANVVCKYYLSQACPVEMITIITVTSSFWHHFNWIYSSVGGQHWKEAFGRCLGLFCSEREAVFKCYYIPSLEEVCLIHETSRKKYWTVFNKALNFVALWGQSLCLFGNPFLKKGNVSGMVWGFVLDLELNCWNILNKLFNLFLLVFPPFLPRFLLHCVK